ncbi:MAG: thioredoxin [Candidatus Omnitrophica bacterium]|nr:thioredoxin [Candidatus Omnitrophota bacterium]
MALALTTENFEQEVVKSDLPVLVDFWAQWCGPCRVLTPLIHELVNEYKGKVKVCKLNIDDAPDVAARYGVMSIPTVMVFNNGQVVGESVGVVSKEKLVSMFSSLIKNNKEGI